MKDKIKAIYYRDGATTVCLLQEQGEVVSRGLAVHSRHDYYDYDEGKERAHKRALEARGRQRNCEEIKLQEVDRWGWFDAIHLSLARDRFGDYKGYYKPELTSTENILLEYRNGNTPNSA